MDKQIKDYDPVTTPAITDTFACQQSGVTRKITTDQILSTITGMSAASTLAGTEITLVQQTGVSKKITLADLADYIIRQA